MVQSEGLDAGASLLKSTDVAEKPKGNGTLVGIKASEGEVDVLMTEQMLHSSSVGRFVDDVHVSAGQPQIDSSNLDNGQNNVVNSPHAALESERGECEGSKVEAQMKGRTLCSQHLKSNRRVSAICSLFLTNIRFSSS